MAYADLLAIIVLVIAVLLALSGEGRAVEPVPLRVQGEVQPEN